MDFKTHATADLCEKPSDMTVIDPDTGDVWGDEGKPVVISVLGSEGRTYKALVQGQTQTQIDALSRSGRRPGVVSAAANSEAEIATVAACTKAWTNVVWEGAPLVCTPKNAAMLYDKCPWLLAQVQDHMTRIANYLGNA